MFISLDLYTPHKWHWLWSSGCSKELTMSCWVNLTLLLSVFPKVYLIKSGWSPGFLWLLIFSSVTSHLSWKFHWNSSSRSEDMKIFFVNINYFHQFFGCCNISMLYYVTIYDDSYTYLSYSVLLKLHATFTQSL